MNDWGILGIEKTRDLKKVKQAYAEKTKLYHPETHPEEFQQLHDAYKRISAEIRQGADDQQGFVQKPETVREPEKQLKPVRDLKQDEDFLRQFEEAAINFEARHTDKRDPAQVAKVEAILQNDAGNSKLLQRFQWLLYNGLDLKEWRNFFVSKEFLERQYEPDFINGMTEIFKSLLLEKRRAKHAFCGFGEFEYFMIVYGPIFEETDCSYQKELLRGLVNLFLPNDYNIRSSYQRIAENEELLGEQYAFSLYRSILEELDADIPAKDKIRGVLVEGFQKKDISQLFFDLLLYLISSNRKNIPVFHAALAQVCEMEWDSSIQDEVEILRLELQEVKPQKETQIPKEQATKTQSSETQTKENKFFRAIGKWMLWIAGIILCINVISRVVDGVKTAEEFVLTTGTVTKEQVTYEWRRAAGRSQELPSYHIWVKYQPQGGILPSSITEIYSEDMFSKGDTVSVIYRKDAVYDAYVAQKDWMTGAYLPITRSYNTFFIISIVLLIIGFLFYRNSPALDVVVFLADVAKR